MMEAASAEDPDVYVLPESPWYMYLNPEARDLFWLSRTSFERLRQFSMDHGAYVVTGSASRVDTPLDIKVTSRAYNSATVFHPDGREPGRYDKIHLVYFGEVVPFRFTRFHSLYLWLNSLMPFSGPDGEDEYSIFRGDEFRVFKLEPPSKEGKSYRIGVPICYEDVMPYVSREFARGRDGRKRVDLLLNISNDGWFGRGIQQP
jgi:apolipoprotein N-acyltransferase